MSRWSVDWRQVSILSDRYLEVMVSDPRSMLLLLVQAPLIGGLVAGVWSNAQADSLTLYFVLVLSAFFLGAVNSAREIVKERDLFLRERLYNLSAGAYVISKYKVQAISMVVQCTLLTVIVDRYVPLEVHPITLGAAVLMCALCGTAVGLAISAVVRSADKAVMMVPLVVIPQILFSKLMLPGGDLHNWSRHVQRAMPVHWGYQWLDAARSGGEGWTMVGAVLMLVGMTLLGYGFTVLVLSRARY